VIVADLARGSVVYVDRDWLPSTSGEVTALMAAPDGAIAWCGGPSMRMPGTVDSDSAAAVALLYVARAAVTALEVHLAIG
jgi:hypothetical protein